MMVVFKRYLNFIETVEVENQSLTLIPSGEDTSAPRDVGCLDEDDFLGTNYTGGRTTTKSGRTCQHWCSDSPHSHSYNDGGEGNFCRFHIIPHCTLLELVFPPGTPPIPTGAPGATQQTLTRDGNTATSPPAPKIPQRPLAGIGGRAKGSTTEGQSQSRRPEPPARSGLKPTWATGGTARWASGDGRTTSAGTQTSRTAGPGAMCLAPRTPTTLADKAGTTALSRTAKVNKIKQNDHNI